MGYTNPTAIQEKAIPVALGKRDIIGVAKSGTGKSCAFLLPILEDLIKEKNSEKTNEKKQNSVLRALILVPTRELAKQIANAVDDYSKYIDIKKVAIFGGISIKDQEKKLNAGVDIAVATTGRLLEHIKNNTINLSSVQRVVIDELDTMLDMGFLEEVEQILPHIGKNRQISMFSATINSTVKKLAKEFLTDPVVIEVAQQRSAVKIIDQQIILVDEANKAAALSYIIGSRNYSQVLVFVNMKIEADTLVEHLELDGLPAGCIHGDVRQTARAKVMKKFKSGDIRVLVATDIAARGIDIDQLPHVINFELPNVPEDYVHRIGRTGRAGNSGDAISLVCIDEHDYLLAIEKLIKQKINKIAIEGFKVNPNIKAEPISNGRNRVKSGANRATQSRASKTEDKTSSSKRTFGRSRRVSSSLKSK